MEKCIIVAVADNWAIGKANEIPWHISDDLKFFRKMTSGYPVIMGRKTYESIGAPLQKRKNIVVAKHPVKFIETCVECVSTIEDALDYASGCFYDKCFIIGGGQIYSTAMNIADVLYVTHVHTNIENADTFFPEIDSNVWERINLSKELEDTETGVKYQFVKYVRKK